jgi:predicted HicB family RNase H-like nuclease
MSPEMKTAQVNLRLHPNLKQAAEQAAARDHRSLTSLIEKLLTDYLRSQPTLEDWHNGARGHFLHLLVEKNRTDPLVTGTLTRSYCVHTADGERLGAHMLTRTLREVHNKVAGLIDGSGLFYPYSNRPELAPYFTSDRRLFRGRTEEILECVVLPGMASIAEFWRVSMDGLATDIRQHVEDQPDFAARGLEPEKWFSPFFMTRALAELVHHASIFAERFESAELVEFRCEWSGLREREISDADRDVAMTWGQGKIARVGEVATSTECPARDLRARWDDVVSALGGPTMRLFDPSFDYSREWVQCQVPRFKR